MPLTYLAAWCVIAFLAIGNGIVREKTYGRTLSELRAHQLSTVIAMVMVWIVVVLWNRVWPIGDAREAWIIGLAWLLMTIVFEFGFGRFVAGHAWEKLFADYNLKAGRVWGVFLLWILIVPYVSFSLTAGPE